MHAKWLKAQTVTYGGRVEGAEKENGQKRKKGNEKSEVDGKWERNPMNDRLQMNGKQGQNDTMEYDTHTHTHISMEQSTSNKAEPDTAE